MLKIYRGRESIDKEKFIYRSIRKSLDAAKTGVVKTEAAKAGVNESAQEGAAASGVAVSGASRAIVVVPDQYTLAAEKQAMKRLDTRVLLDIEITGISHLGGTLLSDGGINTETVIDTYGRHMLISRILRELDGEFEVFKGFYGRETFIEAINDFVSKSKHYEIKPEALMELAEKSVAEKGKGAFGRKLKDLALIYAKYCEKLEGKYTDNEGLLDLYIEAARESELVRKSQFWFYNFDSYTPKNMRFIAALAEYAKEVSVYIPYDKDSLDEDLFLLSEGTESRLAAAARDRGVGVEIIDVKDEEAYGRSKTPALKLLEKELFAITKSAAKDGGAAGSAASKSGTAGALGYDLGIEILECNSMAHEAEAAAAKVLSLLKDKGMKLSDIVLICNDQKTGGPLIGRAFREFGLGVFDDRKRTVANSPIAIYILSLMEIVVRGYQRSDVIRFLKTGLTGIPAEDIEELENYSLKYDIKGWMWKEPFVLGTHEKRYEEGGLEEVEETHKKVMALTEGFNAVMESSKTYGEFAGKYFEYLTEDCGLYEEVEKLIAKQEELGFLDSAEETEQIWEIIYRLFNQIVEIMDDEVFDGKAFLELLKSGFAAIEVGVLPPTADDILLGTMQRTRSGDVKALLVIGANDNLIPRRDDEDILFSPEELELLSEDGEDLGMDSGVRLMEENLAIYRNLCMPSEELWISYSNTDFGGSELRPSEIVESILEIFPGLKVSEDPITSDDFFQRLGGRVNTLRRYTEAMRKKKAGIKIDPMWEVVEDWLSESDEEDFVKVREALSFENEVKPLIPELARELYSKGIEKGGKPAISLSPSGLEKYSKCPFSYFLSYGLGAEELRINKAGSREIGDLYHGALQGVMDDITRKGNLDTVTREEVNAKVEEFAKAWSEDYRSNVFGRNESEKYLFARALEACKFVAWTLVNQARQGEIKTTYSEVPFGYPPKSDDSGEGGMQINLPAIVREFSGGTAYIRGKIDRLDILKDDRVKIIDYKTGKEVFNKEEAKKGIRLQLMLYMEAAQEGKREPGGVFYFLIKEPELGLAGDPNTLDIEEELQSGYKMNGIMLDNDEVIREIAGDIAPGEVSEVVSLRRTKEGALHKSDTKMLLTSEEFAELQREVDARVDEIIENMSEGKIPLEVKVSGNYSPCTYCGYRGICRFDTVFPGCREVDVMKGEEASSHGTESPE